MSGNGEKLLLGSLLHSHGAFTQFAQVFILVVAVTMYQESTKVKLDTLCVSLPVSSMSNVPHSVCP